MVIKNSVLGLFSSSLVQMMKNSIVEGLKQYKNVCFTSYYMKSTDSIGCSVSNPVIQ